MPTAERSRVAVRDVACSGDELVRVAPGDALSDLLQPLRGCSDGRALVVDSGRLVGILSPIDISRKLQVMDLRGRCDVPDVVPGAR